MGGQGKALLCLAAECCGQAHVKAESVGATVYFKCFFNLFEINASTVKCSISDPKGSDRIDALQLMVEQLSPPPTKDFSIL